MKQSPTRIALKLPPRVRSALLEALRVAPASLRRDASRLLERALVSWTNARREHLGDLAVRRMGKDPKLLAESRKISREFSICDADGLGGA